ncbi:cytokine-inducible SH2-containing protein-like [Betta splendens]|uniref:Cytokine-inducible SH2-containing protein n=1 Tax=Betta splendens TaxID=158456 RepID=A0A6P7MMV1_BETSP|nr:cytokine-inducible SH2-containing protein-like [Betta splendens]
MVAQPETVFHPEEQGDPCCPNPTPPPWDPAEDRHCITTTLQYLQTSGWYWGSISAGEAREALLTKSEGTFLLRDSSHPQYMLALSVKTCCGPTSVRIEYSRGAFWLDSISPGCPQLQSFPDVLSLLQHYTGSGHIPQEPASGDLRRKTKPEHVRRPTKGSGVPLKLMQPLLKPEAFPTLQHLVRLTINRHTQCPERLPLPKPLRRFLQDYPFLI